MRTSEIYEAVLSVEEIVDAVVVDMPPHNDGENWMPLFVVLRKGIKLDDQLRTSIKQRIRAACSPRHVPEDIFAIAEIPRTLSGKVLEVPAMRCLVGLAA